MTATRTTVAFELEILPDEGECYVCAATLAPVLSNPAHFALRNHDGNTTVAACEYHLGHLAHHWDELVLNHERPPA